MWPERHKGGQTSENESGASGTITCHQEEQSRELLSPESQAGAVLCARPLQPFPVPVLLWELPIPVFGTLTGGWRWLLLVFPVLELLLAPSVCVCLSEGAACAAPAPLPSPKYPGCAHLASRMKGQSWHKDSLTLY